MDFSSMTDTEVAALHRDVTAEHRRRQTIALAPARIGAVSRQVLAAEGVSMGDPWRQPTGYHDAYPSGWQVTHNGKTWVALRNGASGEPGVVTGDWQEYQEPGQVVDWVQPQAGSEYPVGALVRHNGRIWENTHTAPNGWEPGTTGAQWTDMGPA